MAAASVTSFWNYSRPAERAPQTYVQLQENVFAQQAQHTSNAQTQRRVETADELARDAGGKQAEASDDVKDVERRCGAVVSSQAHLGSVVTAEAAALCVARSPQGQQAAAKRPAAKPPLTMSEEARQQARAEGLKLLVNDSKTGYFGVCYKQSGKAKPFHAQVKRRGKQVYLGSFATAEEAALCVARSPEGQEAGAAKSTEFRTAKKRPVAAAALAREEKARHVAAEVQSCRAAEDDVLAMLAMAMEATPTVSEEVRQQAEAQYDTEGDEAEDMLAVLMEAYYEKL